MATQSSSTKRAADADLEAGVSIKRQLSSAITSLDEIEAASSAEGISDSHTVYHRYPVERKSDLIIILHEDSVRHEYHAHQQMLAWRAEFFASLIDNADASAQMTLELPQCFIWNPTEFKLCLNACYGEYDEAFNALAHVASKKALAQMIHRLGAVVTIGGETDANGGKIEWTVIGHRDNGETEAEQATTKRVRAFGPCDCVLYAAESSFAEVTDNMNLLTMLEISHYVHNEQLTKLILKVILKFVDLLDPFSLVPVAITADRVNAEPLRKSCIDRMLTTYKWQAEDREQFRKLPHDFLVDLYGAASAKLAEATRKR